MTIFKKMLLLFVCIVPYALLPLMSDLLANRFKAAYTGQSLIPLLINEGCAFLPAFVLAYLEPALPGYVNLIWAFLSSSAYFAAYSWSMFHVRQAELGNLWPIEIVVATAFAVVPMCIEIAVGRSQGASKRR